MTVPTTDNPALELRSFRARRYVPRLQIDADFPSGVNVLLGVNGVGKTTVLRALIDPRLRAPGSSATLVGPDGTEPLPRDRICLLPQRPTLPGHLSVRDLVHYCCHVRAVATTQGDGLLDQLGLTGLAARRVGHLSGGELQRVNLALAFVGNPEVVLLDEPTVALDPLGRELFATALRSLITDRSIVLMSTHVASDIELADRVFLLSSSGVQWQGSADEFLAHAPDARFDTAFARLLRQGAS